MPDAASLLGRPPALGQASRPTDSVASFQNQQLSPLTTGNPLASARPSSLTQDLLSRQPNVGVQAPQDAFLNSLSDSSKRITALYQAAAKKKAERESQGSSGFMGGPGMAWTPSGNLSPYRNRIMSRASSFLGSRYVNGASDVKNRTFDCGGLVMAVYNSMGFNWQYHRGSNASMVPGVRTNVANLRPGDIVVWKDGSHIAIYAGNGQIIEAANPRVGVVRRNLWANPNAVFGIALRLPGE